MASTSGLCNLIPPVHRVRSHHAMVPARGTSGRFAAEILNIVAQM